MSTPRRWRTGALVAAAAIAAACTGGSDGEPPPVAVVTTVAEPPAERVDDGVLRIGAIIPSGDTAVGAALETSLQDSIARINDAGGVLGRGVVVMEADEGGTATSAAQAVEALVADDVDAIIGPTSSNSAIGALDEAVAAGVVMCSATATSIALDGFPDDGLFFRTIATDSLQAVAIARTANDTGARDIVIMHVDDAYGRPYAEATIDALREEGSFNVTTVAVTVGDDDLDDDLDELADSGARTAIILGNGPDTGRFLEAIAQRDDITLANIVVNDAARSAATRPVIAALPSSLRSRITGIAPQIVLADTDPDSDVENLPFATQVEDCVNLIALAAVQSESDSPTMIAGQIAAVSAGGVRCRSFAECVEQLEDGLQINYDGATGITQLDRNGDPSRANFDQFGFNADGSDELQRQFVVLR